MAEGTVDNEQTEQQAAAFKSLADPTRLKLVKLLCRQHEPVALCVNALAEMLGVTQSAVSQHIRVLKSVGLVQGERQGSRVHYAINIKAVKRIHDLLSAVLTEEQE